MSLQTIQGRDFVNSRLIGSGRTYADTGFLKCSFKGCAVGQFDDPNFSTVVRSCNFEQCKFTNCAAQGVLFEDVMVDGLTANRLHELTGCVFSRVVLCGNIGPVIALMPHPALTRRQRFVEGMMARYAEVEWALDISRAAFSDADFYGVPGHLIRYDPNTQVLLRREKIHLLPEENFPPYARVWASRFKEMPFDSLVAIAPKRSKRFADYMRDIEWLYKEGLAG